MQRNVVRVVASPRSYDYDSPWVVRPQEPLHGMGVIIAAGILTPASSVTNASSVSVSAPSGERIPTSVLAIDHDRDLALLANVGPFTSIPPVPIGALAEVGTELEMLCWDDNATRPSLLQGRVAKLDVQRYAHAQRNVLTMTVDVGIGDKPNPGAAFAGGALVGIAHQRPTNTTDAIDLVPAPVIAAFLAAVERRGSHGVPTLGITTQNLQNAALRDHLGGHDGVLVLHVEHGESGDGVLQSGDVLTAIGGRPVTRTGLIDLSGAKVRHDAILGLHHIGDRLHTTIVRNRAILETMVTLTAWKPLVPRAVFTRPRYLVYAGLVFQPLSRDYLTTWETWWNTGPKEFLNFYYLGRRTPDQHEVVILSSILDDDANLGYQHLYNESIATIDGHAPIDFADFVARLDAARGSVHIVTTSGGVIHLNVDDARRATTRVLENLAIPADRA
ncbi:MAG TPA: trypsin-like peptidase domain-containing protein [Kofleriaceae bacterium]|jgi:S1-C subfamily serine protease